jgi:hypothetical protein
LLRPAPRCRLAKIRRLEHYCGGEYEWRRMEAELNALPQFMATIDGQDRFELNQSREGPCGLDAKQAGKMTSVIRGRSP